MSKKEKQKDRLNRIDLSVELIKDGSSEEREGASREMLKLFEPLILSTAQRIALRFPHSVQEIVPIAQSKLIVMVIEYNTPRRDTRGAGLLIGSWAPNITVYLHTNLYYFTMLEIAKDLDGKRKETVIQYSVGDYDLEASEEYSYDFVIEMLDLIENEFDPKTRDVMMLKHIFGFRYPMIAWITGLSGIQIRSALSKVKGKLKSLMVL